MIQLNCQMLTQAINFCKFILFFGGNDYLQKICHILYRWKDDSFAAGYLSLKSVKRGNLETDLELPAREAIQTKDTLSTISLRCYQQAERYTQRTQTFVIVVDDSKSNF